MRSPLPACGARRCRGRCGRVARFGRCLVAVAVMAGACRARGRSPFAVADSLRNEGRSAQAVDLYRALRDSFSRTRDTASWWRAQMYFGSALERLGRRDSARLALAQALSLAGSHPGREGRTRIEMSILLDRVGKFDSSFAEAARADTLARQAHDRPLEVSVYNSYGRIYSLTGRHRQALVAHDSELAIGRETGADPREVGAALNELGIDYRHLGRY